MLAMTGVCATMIVKQWKNDFLPLLRLSLALLFAIAAVNTASPLVSYLAGLSRWDAVGGYAEILLKALGIAVLTQCCAELCRECGENAAATGVELTGKVEILLLCLPLMSDVLSVAEDLLTLQVA